MDIRDASRPVPGGIEADIAVTPSSEVTGTHGINEWRKRLSVRVHSPPIGGKANREVIEFIERTTGCRAEIIRGHTNRQKTVMIFGDPDEILKALEASL